MANLPNPHDALFRALLGAPDRARAFLREHLPNDIAGHLADDPPEILEGGFVDEALAGSRSDLLMKVRLTSGGEALMFVLAEHKSAPDPGLPLQLAGYMVRIWKRHAGTDARRLRALPPILPVVVYHGAARWHVPEGLAGMIAAPDPALVFLPGAGYILRNLRALPDGALSGNAALRAGFVTLRREALDDLSAIAAALPEGSDLRRQVVEYILRVYDVDMEELKAALRRDGQTEMEALMGTIADTLMKQGHAEGRAEGLKAGEQQGLAKGEARGLEKGEARGLAKGEARGLEKGRVEGEARSLTRLLERRFGPLPDALADRIAEADIAELERWTDRVLAATSLEVVFDPQA